MATYEVFVIRTSYVGRTIMVEANDAKEAENKALDKAGDLDFRGEDDCEYTAETVKEVKE